MLKYGIEYGLPHPPFHFPLIFQLFGLMPFHFFWPFSRFSNSSFHLEVTRITNWCFQDHSLSHHDCLPYYIRTGDTWVKIDYSKPASHWMKPLVRGSETGIVEIPVNWYLDDLPPMMYMKKVPNSHGWVNAKDVEELWKDHFDYFYREYDNFCFPVTIHPDVSGHPHVLLMLER